MAPRVVLPVPRQPTQTLLHEHEAHRTHVGRSGAHLGEVVDLSQQGIVNRLVEPDAVRAGLAKDQVQALVVQAGHALSPCESLSWSSAALP